LSYSEDNLRIITTISDNASKEYAIEHALQDIARTWNELKFEIIIYKSNTFKIKFVHVPFSLLLSSSIVVEQYCSLIILSFRVADELIHCIDEHTAYLSTIKGARHTNAFQHDIDYWERSLAQMSEIIDDLFHVQRHWLYLEGIFTCDDVQRQLSRETNEFQRITMIWQDDILVRIRSNPSVLFVATQMSTRIPIDRTSIESILCIMI
jgi:dynein heavy chain, axonemal